MKFTRQESIVKYKGPTAELLNKPKAVPGGRWTPGSDTILAWIPDTEDQEKGEWAERPMKHCSFCDIENHLEICQECSDIRGTDGKFDRICIQCEGHFNTSNNWQVICSYRCRQDRQSL